MHAHTITKSFYVHTEAVSLNSIVSKRAGFFTPPDFISKLIINQNLGIKEAVANICLTRIFCGNKVNKKLRLTDDDLWAVEPDFQKNKNKFGRFKLSGLLCETLRNKEVS